MAISVILSRLTNPPVVSISTMAYLRSMFLPSGPSVYILGHLISMFFVICSGCAQIPVNKSNYEREIMPGAWSVDDYLPLVKGKRVGLVINQTSTIGNQFLVDSLVTL